MAFSAGGTGKRMCPSNRGSNSGSCVRKGDASSLSSKESPKSAVYSLVSALARATNPQSAVAVRLPSLNNDYEPDEKAPSSSKQQTNPAFDNSGYASYSEIQAARRGSYATVPTQREPTRRKPSATPTFSDYDYPTNALSDGQKDRKPTSDEENIYADPWDFTDVGKFLSDQQQLRPSTSPSPLPLVPRSPKRTIPPDTEIPIQARVQKSAKTSSPIQKATSKYDAGPVNSSEAQFTTSEGGALIEATPTNFTRSQNQSSRCATRTLMQQPATFVGTSSLPLQSKGNTSRNKMARPSQPPPPPPGPPSRQP